MLNKVVAAILVGITVCGAVTWLSQSQGYATAAGDAKQHTKTDSTPDGPWTLKSTDDESKLKPLPANATAEQRLRAALPRPMLLRCEKLPILKIAAELETLLKVPVLLENAAFEVGLKQPGE